MIPLLMLSSAGFLWLTDGKTVENDPWMSSALFATMWLLAGAYFVFSWRRGGQTVGMRPWRLRVVDEGGQAASVASLCVRYVVACLTPVLGLLWSVVDSQGRALYEIASHTRLVRMRR